MALQPSFPGPSGITDQYAARKNIGGLILRDTTGAARPGVFYAGTDPLVAGRSDMQVDVRPFAAVAVQFGGPILLSNDQTLQVPIAPAPGSNTRIDIVYAKQDETDPPATDGDNLPILSTAQGTAAATPIAPQLPVGAVELARLTVPAGVTATNQGGVTITQFGQFAALNGAPVPFRSQAAISAWNANVPPGTEALNLADLTRWRRTTTDWISEVSQETVGVVAAGGALGNGWTASPVPLVPRIVREGNKRTLLGSVNFGTGSAWGSLLTVPVIDRPPTAAVRTVGVGACYQSAGTVFATIVFGLSAGVLGMVSTSGWLPGAGARAYLDGLTWYLD